LVLPERTMKDTSTPLEAADLTTIDFTIVRTVLGTV
jgi:hypothetical protein